MGLFKFSGSAASAAPDRNGNTFSMEALQRIARQASERTIPVTRDFDHTRTVGAVFGGTVDGGILQVQGVLHGERPAGFVVPGYRVDAGGEIILLCFGLTKSPADSLITPISVTEVS